MTEGIDSNKILESTDYEVSIHLLVSLKCTVIVVDPVSPIRKTPHSTSRVFCETNVGNSQHKIESTTYHYSQ